MPTPLLLTIEVKSKAIVKITLVKMTKMVDPLAPKLIKLGENHAIGTRLTRLDALAERVKTILILADPNFLTPSVEALIISLATA